MKKILDTFEKAIKIICAVLLIGVMVMVTLQVFTRYVLNDALPWSEHAARAMFIWMIMLYAGVLVRNAGNLGFDLLANRLSKTMQNVLGLICDAGILGFAIYWCIQGFTFCQSVAKFSFADLKLPYNTIYLAEPIGAILVTIFSVEVIVRRVMALSGQRRLSE